MIKTAATVVLWSDEHDGVLLVERSPQLRFFGGFHAFPGGVLEPGDGQGDVGLDACARRELLEETAIDLQGAPLTPLGHFLTPPFAPVRFDARFFFARAPRGCVPRVDGSELVAGSFVRPHEVVARWTRGEIRIAPPVLLLLEFLARDGVEGLATRVGAITKRYAEGELPHVRFSPGAILASLRTPTLPPATTTNTYVVGHERFVVIDPGTPEATEQQRLFALLRGLMREGRAFDGVVLTHHHPDHIGAVAATCATFDVPLLAHARTHDRVEAPGTRRVVLDDGARIALGRAPDDSPDFALVASATPGHAQGHLVFRDTRYGALFAGDLVSTLSTIVIDPPEGHMATYWASLERAAALAPTLVYPAHGPPAIGGGVLKKTLAHRKEREAKLIDALTRGLTSEDALLADVYADVDVRLLPIAARSLRAGLEKLAEDGVAVERESTWSPRRLTS
jgi:ribonuclease/clavin/mitogillin